MCSSDGQPKIPDFLHQGTVNANGARRKKALRKLGRYLRYERGYSEEEIQVFIAESFLENKD